MVDELRWLGVLTVEEEEGVVVFGPTSSILPLWAKIYARMRRVAFNEVVGRVVTTRRRNCDSGVARLASLRRQRNPTWYSSLVYLPEEEIQIRQSTFRRRINTVSATHLMFKY